MGKIRSILITVVVAGTLREGIALIVTVVEGSPYIPSISITPGDDDYDHIPSLGVFAQTACESISAVEKRPRPRNNV